MHYDKVTGSYRKDAVRAGLGAYKDEGGLVIVSRCHSDRGEEDGLVQHDDGRVVVAFTHK